MIKALLWKDVRLNRLVFVVVSGLLLAPYLAMTAVAVNESYAASMPIHRSLPNLMLGANHFCLMFWPAAAALLGGNAFACERADRSAEFLAYLPPSKAAIAGSKLAVAAATATLFWTANGLVYWMAAASIGDDSYQYIELSQSAPKWNFAAVGLLTFGCAWLASAAFTNTGSAIVMGLAAPAVLFFALQFIIWAVAWPGDVEFGRWFVVAAASLGAASLLGGWQYYLRRVEP